MRAALAFCLVFAAMPAAAECYAVNPASGSVSFELKQAGSPFRGTFRRFGGELCLGDARGSRIEVWLEPASVDTGLPEIDAALREKEFFAVTEFPRIAFASDSVEERADGQHVRGTLDIKGRRREFEVPFSVRVVSGRPTVSGSFVLNRLEYRIGTGEWSNTRWLGAEVKVEFTATLENQRVR